MIRAGPSSLAKQGIMSEIPQESRSFPGAGGASSLVERVRQRVVSATAVLERRDDGRRSRPPRNGAGPLPGSGPPAGLTRELRALRLVFLELRTLHRRYRHRTGTPVPPELLSAARAFRQEPSLISLVPVAGYLDDLELLRW